MAVGRGVLVARYGRADFGNGSFKVKSRLMREAALLLSELLPLDAYMLASVVDPIVCPRARASITPP